MRRFSMAVALVLVVAGVAQAGFLSFESPSFTVGALDGQGGWTSTDGVVTDADSSEGSQSITPGPTGMTSMNLGKTSFSTESYRVSADVRLGGSTLGYLAVSADSEFTTAGGKVIEWGWDGGFYAHGANQYTVEGSTPDSDRWVTLWGDFYSVGGDLRANLGWCELSQTPFVDGVRISNYDCADRDVNYLGARTSSSAFVDNINAPVPEPSAIVLALSGLVGLVCYAWRKRK